MGTQRHHRTPLACQGACGAFFLVGCGLVYSLSPMGASSVADGVGLLLLLLGWGLLIPRPFEEPSTG
jgi:hypothetical protein